MSTQWVYNNEKEKYSWEVTGTTKFGLNHSNGPTESDFSTANSTSTILTPDLSYLRLPPYYPYISSRDSNSDYFGLQNYLWLSPLDTYNAHIMESAFVIGLYCALIIIGYFVDMYRVSPSEDNSESSSFQLWIYSAGLRVESWESIQ